MSDDCKGNGGAIFVSFLAGAVIGGGLALLMAPRSGAETRTGLREAGDEARERLRGLLDETEQRLREPLDDFQELLEQKKEVFLAALEAGRQAAEEQKDSQRQNKPQ